MDTDRKFTFNFYAKLLLRFKRGGDLLELGCGYGYLLERFEKYFKTYGIDISQEAIEQNKKICRNSKTFVGDARDLSYFKEGCFDAVIALHVLEHINEPEKVISEVHRVLKSDGVFLFVVPNTSSILRGLKGEAWCGHRDETHVSLFPPEKWIKLITKQKFSIIKIASDGFWDSPYVPFIPGTIQKPIFGFLTAIQFLSGRLFIPIRLGENIIVLSRKES